MNQSISIFWIPTSRVWPIALSSGRALGILRESFPSRPVIDLDSTDLIWGLCSFHSLTQQEPAEEQLALESITVTVLVEFMAHSGIAYRLQAQDDLAKGQWITIGQLEPRPTSGLVRLPEFLPGSQ